MCLNQPVTVVRGSEEETFALTRCDGTVAPLAVDHLSVLTRPGNVPRTSEKQLRLEPELVERLQRLVDAAFPKNHGTPKIWVVSGYRPGAVGSFHSHGKALDFRMEGIANEKVVELCKALEDTGCGYYPNSSFVHMDVRSRGAGHVSWIDASAPGEKPRYVTSWPVRRDAPAWLADFAASLGEQVAAGASRAAAEAAALPTQGILGLHVNEEPRPVSSRVDDPTTRAALITGLLAP